MIMGDILKLVVVVAVMFVVNWKLALLSMVPIPLLLWSTNIFKNSIQKSFQDVRTQVARLNTFVQEHIQGMAVVQVFGREQQEYVKFKAINKEHRAAHIRSVLAYSIFFPVVEILSAISLGFLVWWGVKEGAIDLVSISDKVPEDTRKKVDEIKAGLKSGTFVIWKGPIKDQAGKEVLAKDAVADDKFLHNVKWYVQGVDGKVPSGG